VETVGGGTLPTRRSLASCLYTFVHIVLQSRLDSSFFRTDICCAKLQHFIMVSKPGRRFQVVGKTGSNEDVFSAASGILHLTSLHLQMEKACVACPICLVLRSVYAVLHNCFKEEIRECRQSHHFSFMDVATNQSWLLSMYNGLMPFRLGVFQ